MKTIAITIDDETLELIDDLRRELSEFRMSLDLNTNVRKSRRIAQTFGRPSSGFTTTSVARPNTLL